MSAIYEFNGGIGDSMTVYGDRVELVHKGKMAKAAFGDKPDKAIYFADMDSVEWQKATGKSGYILFRMPEDRGMNFSYTEAVYTVHRPARLQQTGGGHCELHERRIIRGGHGGRACEAQASAGLLDMGIITQAEFDAKKSQLLGL